MTVLAASSAAADSHGAPAVDVVTIDRLALTEQWPAGARMVVDATGVLAASLPMLEWVAQDGPVPG